MTYYAINGSEFNVKTADTDFTLSVGVNRNYIKIINFEFRLSSDGITSSFNEELNVHSYSGRGFIYPKFNVNIGDIFLYEIDPGNIGLFKITSKKPLSIHRDTLHEVDFELILFPTSADLQELNTYVDETVYFFKDTFFNGDVGLIYDETYQLLLLISQYKNLLLYFYIDKFYDETRLQTFVRPDGIYDPYIVEFLFKFINFHKTDYYPKRLLTEYPNKNKNIYSFLMDSTKYLKELIPNYYSVFVKTYAHRDTDINGLINRQYLLLDKVNETNIPYHFNTYMKNDQAIFSTLDSILYKYETEMAIDPTILMTFIKTFKDWSDEDQFYNIPICLFLLAVMEGFLLK